MNLNLSQYRDKVLACWMGKNIGGTLGAPFEWRRQVNEVSFYTQDLCGEPLPNDDLDIQLLWLVALEERGVDLTAQTLADYWCLYVTPHWSEYGTAKTNMRSGLMPPLSGMRGNEFKDSCGAFIRSEIWACIAPGAPKLAAQYAYEDAILDHGDGEGMWAEVFCAALESAAFVCSDLHELIRIGLSYLPEDCGIAGAIKLAVECHRSGKTWLEAREAMLQQFRGSAFFKADWAISAADRAKGYFEGKFGWDAPSNLGMLIIGLLYGEGDFAKSICIAVNCGEDTDCTGATVGSIFGIMHGMAAIPEKWIAPIGRKIKTACLNLGELGYFGNQLPQDCDAMTERTARVAQQVVHRLPITLLEAPTDLEGLQAETLRAGDWKPAGGHYGGPVYKFDFFNVGVEYPGGAVLRDNVPTTLRVKIVNTYKTQANLNVRLYAPAGVRVLPAAEGCVLSLPGHLGKPQTLEFQVLAEKVPGNVNRLVLEVTIDGRPTVMLVPIVLLNDNLRAL